MDMIKRAVAQRPDDGYIVDSLGWAYYRLGNYEEAVKQLERAIELKPEDPTINDHLGDAYWRVGRTLEANSSGRMRATSSPSRKNCRRSWKSSPTAFRTKPPPRPRPATRPPRRTATAAERVAELLRELAPAKVNLTLRVVSAAAPTAITSWKVSSRSPILPTL